MTTHKRRTSWNVYQSLTSSCTPLEVFGIYGLQETEEGVDKKLASRYYSRWALTHVLLPLLHKAKDEGEPASVLSILAAGMGPQVDLDDLGLKNSYSGIKAMMQSVSYNDLMVAVSHS